jgi:hypothetical protein
LVLHADVVRRKLLAIEQAVSGLRAWRPVMSNHHHAVVTDTRGVLPEFLRELHRPEAVGGRRGLAS